jgi:hypothetical protein
MAERPAVRIGRPTKSGPSSPDLCFESLERAADPIESADALVIGGAGMGVASALPDFRGPGGFRRA